MTIPHPAVSLGEKARGRCFAVWQIAVAALLAIMFGWGRLVTLENVGLFQRAFALALIPGIGFACAFLARRERM